MPTTPTTSTERLSEVFDLVKPEENWKLPIDALVHSEAASAQEIEEAVAFYCGGYPALIAEGAFWRVIGDGYYVWIGA